MDSFNLIFEILSIFLVLLGTVIIIQDVRMWNRTELTTLKAKVFLDKSFLKYNFIIFSIIGLAIGYHIFMETVQFGDVKIPSSLKPVAFFLYYSSLLVGLACISLMGLVWNRLLKHKTR